MGRFDSLTREPAIAQEWESEQPSTEEARSFRLALDTTQVVAWAQVAASTWAPVWLCHLHQYRLLNCVAILFLRQERRHLLL